ncbi:CBM21 domain-containing protein [Plasmodiophora brassicae]
MPDHAGRCKFGSAAGTAASSRSFGAAAASGPSSGSDAMAVRAPMRSAIVVAVLVVACMVDPGLAMMGRRRSVSWGNREVNTFDHEKSPKAVSSPLVTWHHYHEPVSANVLSWHTPVALDAISFVSERLMGLVHVVNIHWKKNVILYYTFDNWDTKLSVRSRWQKQYFDYLGRRTIDIFRFDVDLMDTFLETDRRKLEMKMYVEYGLPDLGHVYFDNNHGHDYLVVFEACDIREITSDPIDDTDTYAGDRSRSPSPIASAGQSAALAVDPSHPPPRSFRLVNPHPPFTLHSPTEEEFKLEPAGSILDSSPPASTLQMSPTMYRLATSRARPRPAATPDSPTNDTAQ